MVLVSNAPVPEEGVATMLDSRGVPRAAYDAIVASGDIALRHVADQGYRRVFCIGPADRDSLTFRRLTAERADLDTADAILCTGLNDDRNETAETYRPLLARARARGLPFVCANPDLVVDVGGRQYLCAGAIADLYERMDGEVRLISPRIDPDTKLGRVRVSLAPHPQLRVGGYARVDFHRPFDPVPAVAEKALQWEANGPRLITIDDDNRARPVAVRVGTRDGDFISLVQGPPVGTRVALGSGVSLLEGDLVNPLEAQDASASAQVEPPP